MARGGQWLEKADSARRVLPWVLLSVGVHVLGLWPTGPSDLPLPAPGQALQARWVAPAGAPAADAAAPKPQTAAQLAAPERPARPAPRQEAASAPPPEGAALALQFPAQGEFRYALRWQGDAGEALLRFAQDGERYRLSLERGTGRKRLPDWVSEGRIGPGGLQPERFEAGRRAWSPQAGAQDRLSWIWQAAALAQAQNLQAGQRLRVAVQNWRGEVNDWVLLAEPDAEQPGLLRLRRELPEGALLEQLLWLDPAQGHRPVRLRVRFDAQERWELGPRDISPTRSEGD